MSGLCNFGVLNYAAFLTGFSRSVASFFAGTMELILLLMLVMS